MPSGRAKCCKLQHFVHGLICLCSNFKRAMLSHVLCILPQETTLQIETGPHRGFYAEKSLHKGAFYIQKVLHREAFTLRSFGTQTSTQTSRSFYTQKFLREEVFTQRAFYTQTRLHTEAFAQRSLYTEELLHTKAFTHSKLSHTHTGAVTQRSLYTEELFIHRRFYTEKSLL